MTLATSPAAPIALGSAPRASVICNPRSGTHNVRDSLPAALDVLRECGWQVDLQLTRQAGDMGRLAAQAREAHQDIVIVAGGDGSVNEAATALAQSDVALGVLPSGTANVWARQIGLPVPMALYPNQLIDAARALAGSTVRPIDLGRIGDRYFVLWSGIGIDAQITAEIEPRPPWMKRFGIVGYSWRAFWIALRYRGARMSIDIDAEHLKCRSLLVLISNIQLYGGITRVTAEAVLDDGLLDVVIFKGEGFLEVAGHFLRVILRRGVHSAPDVITRRARHIHIDAHHACYVHVDAEPIGRTPVDVDVVPHALQVLVPAAASKDLFVP
jgi:YegS/Rv2252/BmrU family lipid kinase